MTLLEIYAIRTECLKTPGVELYANGKGRVE